MAQQLAKASTLVCQYQVRGGTAAETVQDDQQASPASSTRLREESLGGFQLKLMGVLMVLAEPVPRFGLGMLVRKLHCDALISELGNGLGDEQIVV
jgi:hypothetical protein